MQHVHRTTVWRRRKNAVQKARTSRRLKGGKEDRYNLDLLAKLLRAYWEALAMPQTSTSGVSIATARAMREDMALSVLRNVLLGGSPYPVGALVTAIWDRLKPEARRRTNTARGRGVSIKRNNKLRRFIAENANVANPKEAYAIEKAAIARLVRDGHSRRLAQKLVEEASPRGQGWVRELAERGSAGMTVRPSERTACASRWFKITPRMLSYYRTAYDCEHIADEITGLINEALKASALDNLMKKAAMQLMRSKSYRPQ